MGFLTGSAKREAFEYDTTPRTETVYNSGTFGGGETKLVFDKTSPTGRTEGPRSDEKELARYRSLAEAAAKREAYKVDFSEAQADRTRGQGARAQQAEGLGMQQEAAMGNAPSRAAIMGNQAAGNSLEAAMAASAGARPSSLAAASAAAQQGQAGAQLGAQQQAMGGRSQEMNAARSGLVGGATNMRAGDYANMAMSQEQAEAQAKSEIAQRHLNQTAQMGYEQMGLNVEQEALDASMRGAAVLNQRNATAQGVSDGRDARNRQIGTAIISAYGAAAGSDERMKQGVKPLSFAGAHAGMQDKPMGEALADMKPYEYEYKSQHAGAEGQQTGEKNVGPMAQDMAKNPITGSAVVKGGDGLLKVDMTKAGKLSLGAIGYLAAKQREQDDEIARLKKGGR